MAAVLQFGDRAINANEIVPLLVQYQLLPQLLRELAIDTAISEIALSETEQAIALAQFDAQHQIADAAARQDWINQQGISVEQLGLIVFRPYRIEKFKVLTWEHRLNSYFLTQKPQYDQVTYSLLRTPDPEIVQELYFRIKAGEQSFAQLAREYSQGPEAETDGVIGPVAMSQPHPAVAERLRHAQPGQVLPPTRLGDWYVLLRLESLVPAKLDDPMRQKLLNELFDAWITEQLAAAPSSPTRSLAHA